METSLAGEKQIIFKEVTEKSIIASKKEVIIDADERSGQGCVSLGSKIDRL